MIEVGRNSIVVRNVDLESAEFKKLNSTFSLYDQVQHKYTFGILNLIFYDLLFLIRYILLFVNI